MSKQTRALRYDKLHFTTFDRTMQVESNLYRDQEILYVTALSTFTTDYPMKNE